MNIELVGEAKKVLLMSWAARFAYLATFFGILAQLQPYLPTLQSFVPANVFGILTIICTVAVPIARVVKQRALRDATGAANGQLADADVTPAG